MKGRMLSAKAAGGVLAGHQLAIGDQPLNTWVHMVRRLQL